MGTVEHTFGSTTFATKGVLPFVPLLGPRIIRGGDGLSMLTMWGNGEKRFRDAARILGLKPKEVRGVRRVLTARTRNSHGQEVIVATERKFNPATTVHVADKTKVDPTKTSAILMRRSAFTPWRRLEVLAASL